MRLLNNSPKNSPSCARGSTRRGWELEDCSMLLLNSLRNVVARPSFIKEGQLRG